MNRDELSRMLDLVDEKYLNEALENESDGTADLTAYGTDTVTAEVTSTVPAVKRRRMGSGFACIAAALALVTGLTLLTNNPKEISVEEKQGAVTDSWTVTDIIETDIPENEPYDYGDLFRSPVDLGISELDGDSDDETVYYYNDENVNSLFPENAAALLNGRFSVYVSASFDESGEIYAADIELKNSGSFLDKLEIVMEKDHRLWNNFFYSEKTERLGKSVHSCYCEKNDGLHLWAYVENEEMNCAFYSLGFERGEAALILDSIITGSISLDRLTPDSADVMRQNLTVEQAAALPEFKGKICTENQLGGLYLRNPDTVVMKFFNKGEAYLGIMFCVVYDSPEDSGESVSLTYSADGNGASMPAAEVTADIESVTREKIDEWCSSGEHSFCFNAGGVYVTVDGQASSLPEFLEALTERLKAGSG